MILRHSLSLPHCLALCAVLLFVTQQTSAQDVFDCHITIGDTKYDLAALGGEHTVSRERDTPPTKFRDTVTFNLCEDLKKVDGVSDNEQCPSETRACLTKTNIKDNEKDRITAVIQLAKPALEFFNSTIIPSPRKGVSLTMKGSSYPNSAKGEDAPQSFNLNLYCDTEQSEPSFKSYNGTDLWIEWQAPAGCAMSDVPSGDSPDPGSGSGGSSSSMGSGIGYFFLLLVLAFGAYFGLGAYYNYSTYGATGLDLIPHRDFWREVPYMLRDVASHLCSAVRPRHTSSRGGYIAV